LAQISLLPSSKAPMLSVFCAFLPHTCVSVPLFFASLFMSKVLCDQNGLP
jgi:hypothetical protein